MKTASKFSSLFLHLLAFKYLFPLLLCLVLGACGSEQQETIIIAGSTSVQPYAEILAEEFCDLYPDLLIDVQGGGSSAGITAAANGTAQIGMSSRALKASEEGFWWVEIARDGLALIVNPANTITDLTLEQVAAIYSGGITDWSALGCNPHAIHVITREEGSGTRSAFEELVMADSLITPKALVQDSNGTVRQLVANNPHAIGFISLGLVDDTVKALCLEGIEATVANVSSGSYGLYRPFLFVAEATPQGAALLYIDFVLSAVGQQQLRSEGLIPVREVAP